MIQNYLLEVKAIENVFENINSTVVMLGYDMDKIITLNQIDLTL